jgi:hypothetical protein
MIMLFRKYASVSVAKLPTVVGVRKVRTPSPQILAAVPTELFLNTVALCA